MKELLEFGDTLRDPLSVRILAILRNGELSIIEIMTVLNEDRSSVRRRLRKLQDTGILRHRRRGVWLAFRIHTSHADLVETVFEAFEDSIGWDTQMSADLKSLEEQVKNRPEEWTPSKRSSRRSRMSA